MKVCTLVFLLFIFGYTWWLSVFINGSALKNGMYMGLYGMLGFEPGSTMCKMSALLTILLSFQLLSLFLYIKCISYIHANIYPIYIFTFVCIYITHVRSKNEVVHTCAAWVHNSQTHMAHISSQDM